MFGRLLKKYLGKGVGTVADKIIDDQLDKATGGLSTKAEKAVKKIRRRQTEK